MNAALVFLLQLLLGSTIAFAQTATSPASGKTVKIRITDGALVVTATLNESAAAADFASMLPLSLTLEDYAAAEKIARLPRKLNNAGAPSGMDPEVGDFAYYAPWGNLALYYRDAVFDNGLIRLGRLDGGAAALQRFGSRTKVRIERAE